MPNTFITPWSNPVTNHSWFVAPADDARDYTLTRKYRQGLMDRQLFWGTRYSPKWSYYGGPTVIAGFLSWFVAHRGYRQWWVGFYFFPAFFVSIATLIRFHREFYFEYQIHKILTWGQFELSAAKRRLAGAKEHPVPTAERRSEYDLDRVWKHGSRFA
ncbi:hypothetical protein DIPPA_14489 [Diplonema papillatum]|nr:hypothetical protein DIPPA_14489 [Diplonema papillatum]